MNNLKKLMVGATAAIGLVAGSAANATIVSAVAGTINSGGPGFGTLTETFNQAGLSSNYVSGVTDFNTYIASGPTHTVSFGGFEWFSSQGSSSASVTYDLGSVMSIDALALWNEESSGIGTLDLFGSTDGMSFFSLASGLSPTDHGLAPYLADVFTFMATNLRFIRFDMSNCPQPNVGSFAACAIGEVAFRSTDGNVIPLPAAGWLLLSGVGALSVARARRRKTA
jgi:hypothetical protein